MSDKPYFEPLLAWQTKAWQQFMHQHQNNHLPHGLLASGMAGIGKRAFVWRAVAWLLCQNQGEFGACGECASCLWLKADTHPNLHALPIDGDTIKIDDIRALQDFFYTKTAGVRIVVLDNVDKMTLAASNALLKTLEEPASGVFLFLISDAPTNILPTIKSRVQALPLLPIDEQISKQYLQATFPNLSSDEIMTLLLLSDFAPLSAQTLPNQAWFDKRLLWLKTYVALQNGSRTPIMASDYWQSVLDLTQFLWLSRLMLAELWRYRTNLPSLHQDLDVASVLKTLSKPLNEDNLSLLAVLFDEVAGALAQNINEKQAFDALFVKLAT